MNKEELVKKISNLELTLEIQKKSVNDLQSDLAEAGRKLENINKPTISLAQVDEIREAVHQALQQISFDETDSYSYDFEINYDNQLELSNIEFTDVDEINETVCDYVEDCFNVVPSENENKEEARISTY
jgi:hypothetical protein